VIYPMALGALAGLGLWCVLRGVIQPPPPLRVALGDLGKQRRRNVDRLDGWSQRAGTWVMSVTGSDMGSLATDLALLDRSDAYHLVQRIQTACFYGAMPLMAWVLGQMVGVSLMPLGLVAPATLIGLVAGWVITDVQVKSKARSRRDEFDASLVTYLQLVSVLVSGGAGIQQALSDAAGVGDGWTFSLFMRLLGDARIRAVSPWESMDEYGVEFGLDSLIDLAATMELAGTSGAHVRESLLTKAKVLQSRQVAAIERGAAGRTTAMAGPTGLLMAGFVVLVIYPAMVAVLNL